MRNILYVYKVNIIIVYIFVLIEYDVNKLVGCFYLIVLWMLLNIKRYLVN